MAAVVSLGRLIASANGVSPGELRYARGCHAHRRTLVRSTERDHMSTTLDNHVLDQLGRRVTGSVPAPDDAGESGIVPVTSPATEADAAFC